MTGNGKAAQPGNRSRQTSLLGDSVIITPTVTGIFGALVCVGVPFVMALLKCWGCW